MVSFGLDTIEIADRLSAEPAELGADTSTSAVNLSDYSQTVQEEFANGAQHLINTYKPEEFLPLAQATPEDLMRDMSPGEALMTYGIMHNPIMEEMAIAHASDAMAFANDVMLNFSRGIDQKQNAFIANMTIAEIEDMGEDGDDEELTPAQRARKRAAAIEQRMRELSQDLHQEQMEQMREEHMAQWDKDMHMIGGSKFSGADLHNLYLFMQDPQNFNKFTQQLESEGISKEEAKKRADKLKRTLDLLEKERQGKLSEEEQAELERLKRDKQVAEDLQKMKEMNDKTASLEVSQQNAQTWNAETNERKDSIENDKAQNNNSTHDIKRKLDDMISLIEKQRIGKLSASEKKELSSLMEDQDLADLMVEIEQKTETRQKPTELVQANSAEITQPQSTTTADLNQSQSLSTEIIEKPEPLAVAETSAASKSLTATYNPLAQEKINDNLPAEPTASPPQKLQIAQVSNLDF